MDIQAQQSPPLHNNNTNVHPLRASFPPRVAKQSTLMQRNYQQLQQTQHSYNNNGDQDNHSNSNMLKVNGMTDVAMADKERRRYQQHREQMLLENYHNHHYKGHKEMKNNYGMNDDYEYEYEYEGEDMYHNEDTPHSAIPMSLGTSGDLRKMSTGGSSNHNNNINKNHNTNSAEHDTYVLGKHKRPFLNTEDRAYLRRRKQEMDDVMNENEDEENDDDNDNAKKNNDSIYRGGNRRNTDDIMHSPREKLQFECPDLR